MTRGLPNWLVALRPRCVDDFALIRFAHHRQRLPQANRLSKIRAAQKSAASYAVVQLGCGITSRTARNVILLIAENFAVLGSALDQWRCGTMILPRPALSFRTPCRSLDKPGPPESRDSSLLRNGEQGWRTV